MAKSPSQPGATLHPRNRHNGRYDIVALTRSTPRLAKYVQLNPAGQPTIDFANPEAVRALNAALLQKYYGVANWTIPAGYLCPPVPSRADYIHHLADLLAGEAPAGIARPGQVSVIDIGVGANCIYPIIGVAEYGWRFVGVDVDPIALKSAQQIVSGNRTLAANVELRRQHAPGSIFAGVVRTGEAFAAAICNPPFYESAAAAAASTARKRRNLASGEKTTLVRNFGGHAHELWCPGGEVAFVRRMILESVQRPQLCGWFTTLVSNRDSLPPIERTLSAARAAEVRIVPMAHGQKKTRIVAWRF